MGSGVGSAGHAGARAEGGGCGGSGLGGVGGRGRASTHGAFSWTKKTDIGFFWGREAFGLGRSRG